MLVTWAKPMPWLWPWTGSWPRQPSWPWSRAHGSVPMGRPWHSNFKYILIHAGNTDEQTAGCILVGDSQTNNDIKTDGFIGSSRNAYKRIYPLIRDELMAGAKVEIEIIDYEEGMTSSSTVTESKHTKVAGGLYCNQCNKTFKTQII